MLNEFFARHPVFTLEELNQFLGVKGSVNRSTRSSLLAYYKNQRRLLRVRRGLFAVVPSGSDPETFPVDPYLLAGKMTNDAVLAYHTALEFYGKAYSAYERFYYVSEKKSLPVTFRTYEFLCVLAPKALRVKSKKDFAVNQAERAGLSIKVTSLERTLVDVLDRPDLGGSWEEIWRSLETVEFFNLDKVVEYALLLGNATTIAKVGFFLSQHREALMVEEVHLRALRSSRPKKIHYMSRPSKTPGRFVSEWNLIVPMEILERSWTEVA